MGAISVEYVDPSIDTDSGDGSLGNPWGRYSYCLSQMTFDTTNGTAIAIKQGTTMVGSDYTIPTGPNAVDLLWHVVWDGTNAWSVDDDQTALTPPTFDGNNANTPIFDFWGGSSHQRTWIHWINFKFQNSGTAELVNAYNMMFFDHCEFSNSGGAGILGTNFYGSVSDCVFIGLTGVSLQGSNASFYNNYIYTDNSSGHGIVNSGGIIWGNIIDLNGGVAISLTSQSANKVVANNTLVQRTKGTIRDGIWFGTSVAVSSTSVINNIFSGHEAALDGWLSTYDFLHLQGNTFYDCNSAMNAIDQVMRGNAPSASATSDNVIVQDNPLAEQGLKPDSLDNISRKYTYYGLADSALSLGYPFKSGYFRGAVAPPAGSTYSLHPLAYN